MAVRCWKHSTLWAQWAPGGVFNPTTIAGGPVIQHATGGTLAEDVLGVGLSTGATHTFEAGESINTKGSGGGLQVTPAIVQMAVAIIAQIAAGAFTSQNNRLAGAVPGGTIGR